MRKLALVFILSLVLATVANAQEVEPQGLEPRAYLPLLESNYTKVHMHLPQAVIEAGSPFAVEIWVYDARHVENWYGTLVWEAGIRFLDAEYEDGLWPPRKRIDSPIERHTLWTTLEQTGAYPASTRRGLLATYVLLMEEENQEGFWLRDYLLINNESEPYEWRNVYSMDCLCDYDENGRRDIVDVMMVGQYVGRPFFPPIYDLDGDGAVTEIDVEIAKLYWGVPCP